MKDISELASRGARELVEELKKNLRYKHLGQGLGLSVKVLNKNLVFD